MSEVEKKPYTKARVIKLEGKKIHTWDGKFHNLEGPAIEYSGDPKKNEYYVFGKKYTKDEFKKMKKEQNGIPWVKKAGAHASMHKG